MIRHTHMSESDAHTLGALFNRYGVLEVLHTLAVSLECARSAFPNDADYQGEITREVGIIDNAILAIEPKEAEPMRQIMRRIPGERIHAVRAEGR